MNMLLDTSQKHGFALRRVKAIRRGSPRAGPNASHEAKLTRRLARARLVNIMLNEQLDLREGRILPSRRSSCSLILFVVTSDSSHTGIAGPPISRRPPGLEWCSGTS